jgi:hypothetical protein
MLRTVKCVTSQDTCFSGSRRFGPVDSLCARRVHCRRFVGLASIIESMDTLRPTCSPSPTTSARPESGRRTRSDYGHAAMHSHCFAVNLRLTPCRRCRRSPHFKIKCDPLGHGSPEPEAIWPEPAYCYQHKPQDEQDHQKSTYRQYDHSAPPEHTNI